jgi:hypothetical protein
MASVSIATEEIQRILKGTRVVILDIAMSATGPVSPKKAIRDRAVSKVKPQQSAENALMRLTVYSPVRDQTMEDKVRSVEEKLIS